MDPTAAITLTTVEAAALLGIPLRRAEGLHVRGVVHPVRRAGARWWRYEDVVSAAEHLGAVPPRLSAFLASAGVVEGNDGSEAV